MKKILIVILEIIVFIYLYSFVSSCGILPKDTNQTLILDDSIYKLTKNGLAKLGRIDLSTWNMGRIYGNIILNKSQNEIYFFSYNVNNNYVHSGRGIYTMRLPDLTIKPKPTLKGYNENAINILSISPNDNYLLFTNYDSSSDNKRFPIQWSTILLLNLKTGKQQITVDDYKGRYSPVWVNDHQFVYVSKELNGVDKEYDLILVSLNSDKGNLDYYQAMQDLSEKFDKHPLPVLAKYGDKFYIYGMEVGMWVLTELEDPSVKLQLLPFSEKPTLVKCNDPKLIEELKVGHTYRKHILYLYDINSQSKTDMHMDGYYPGALSPNGKELVLSNGEKTVLYNIYDSSTKVIANRAMQVENMIWLPDGKGFLYTDRTYKERLEILTDAHNGLYYYSLEKKKSVRLNTFYDLNSSGGFIVPPEVGNIKLLDTDLNRRISSGESRYSMIKVCKLW